MSKMSFNTVAAMTLLSAGGAFAGAFNGQPDNQRDDAGYYYAVTGGKFVNGQTADGTANGRTIRLLSDDPYWGQPLDVWQKDSFFNDTAGVALTMWNNGNVVYDNNGLEDGSFAPNYYDAQAGDYPDGGHGAVVLYSMSNNYDFIYAGQFQINAPTTVNWIGGYFIVPQNGDPNTVSGPFDPQNPDLAFHMNMFSSFPGTDPAVAETTNTGSFMGDVFSSDNLPGVFAYVDTGYDRVGGSGLTSDIYRLVYELDTPLTLQPGTYFFSHDATLVPEPTSAGLFMVGGLALLARRRSRRRGQCAA